MISAQRIRQHPSVNLAIHCPENGIILSLVFITKTEFYE